MKVMYVGANCRQGTSEKNGRPYTIAEVIYTIPAQHAEKKNPDGSLVWRFTAFGNVVRSINLDPQNLSSFEKVQPGTEVDLVLEPDPANPSRNVVTGIK
jgi:hypothetical protein